MKASLPEGNKYTEVLILGPNIKNVEQYKAVYGPTALIIGDGKKYITREELHEALAGRVDQNTRIDIQCHGIATQGGKHLSQIFDGESSGTETTVLLESISTANPGVPLHIHSWSCYSGAANQYAQSSLPQGSVLVTHSANNDSTAVILGQDGIIKSISRRTQRRNRGGNVFTSRAEFVQNLDIAIDTTTYTETLSTAASTIEYKIDQHKILPTSREASEYLQSRCKEFNERVQNYEAIIPPERSSEDLKYFMDTSFIYKSCINIEQLRAQSVASMKEIINTTALLRSALHTAVLYDRADVIEELANKGANVNIQDNTLGTPLHFAAQIGSVTAVRKLIEKGANVDKENNVQWTPLHCAAMRGNTDIVRSLIEAKADVNKVDGLNQTPLHLAVERGNIEMARELVNAGADVNKADISGKTPLYLAVESGNTDVINVLITGRPDFNARELTRGKVPLHEAIVRNTDITRTLINAGADVNVTNTSKTTPLHYAVVAGNLDTVLTLINSGADVNKADIKDITPLHYAVMKGNTDIVRELMQAGADVNKADISGKTPLDIANEKGNAEVIRVLSGPHNVQEAAKARKSMVTSLRQQVTKSRQEIETIPHGESESFDKAFPVPPHTVAELDRTTKALDDELGLSRRLTESLTAHPQTSTLPIPSARYQGVRPNKNTTREL